MGGRSVSAESSNSFPALLWESPRQIYLAFLTDGLSEARFGSKRLLFEGQESSVKREPLL
jgi:hypothetical protein